MARVDLRVPPRLIESARAAQYSNREALGARSLERRITAKVRQRKEAQERANPLQSGRREGGVLEFRQAPLQRIWRRPRRAGEVNVGVAWLYSDISVNAQPVQGQATPADWSNGPPGNLEINESTSRQYGSSSSRSSTVSLTIKVGSGSGEKWQVITHNFDLGFSISGTVSESVEKILVPLSVDPSGRQLQGTFSRSGSYTNSFYYTIASTILPTGGDGLLYIFSMTQYSQSGSWNYSGSYAESFYLGPGIGVDPSEINKSNPSTVQTAQYVFYVTRSNVTRISAPLPLFVQKIVDRGKELIFEATELSGGFPELYLDNSFPPNLYAAPSVFQASLTGAMTNIGIYQDLFETGAARPAPFRSSSVSSASFERFAADGSILNLTPQQANASYAALTGVTGIPVLGYKRYSQSTTAMPATERGAFGVIPGASVTSAVTSAMRAGALDDELQHFPGADATNQAELTTMAIAYDYHGGTYCRDQLAALGITLP